MHKKYNFLEQKKTPHNMAYHMAYLVSKLIAGHTQDNETLVCVATVQLVHLSVVPGCCSSERRHIFNQHHFPF